MIPLRSICALLLITVTSMTSPMNKGTTKPAALENIGNSCFINAIVQALLSMTTFIDAIKDHKGLYKPGSIARKFQDMIVTLEHSSTYTPQAFATQAWDILHEDRFSQQDAEYFLLTLLNKLIDSDIDPYIKSTLTYEKHLPYPATELSNLISLTTYTYRSHRTEPSLILSLPILDGDVSLHQCIRHLFNGETHSRQFALDRKPHYLLLSLKRNYHVIEGTIGKHTEPITFPLEGLSFQPYTADPSVASPHYDLISVVTHSGPALSGHYTAYVKIRDQWYHCNDSTIKLIRKSEIEDIALKGSAEAAVPTLLIYEQSKAPSEPSAATYAPAAAAASPVKRSGYSRDLTQALVDAVTRKAELGFIIELLEAGADPNARNSHNISVLQLAFDLDSFSTGELLLARGARQ